MMFEVQAVKIKQLLDACFIVVNSQIYNYILYICGTLNIEKS